MTEKRTAVDTSRKNTVKEKASSSDHELGSDLLKDQIGKENMNYLVNKLLKHMPVKDIHEGMLKNISLAGATAMDKAVKKEVKDEPIRKIRVTKLPEETTEETLMFYFENRQCNGGGPIETIKYHPRTSSAIIEFQEANDVLRVLQKQPLLFLKKQISVQEYVEEAEDDEEEKEQPCHTIEVRGFAETAVEEVLSMYFENPKRSGGGEVTSVEITDGVALVTFTDEDVASRVCEREHTLFGHELSVTLHLPKKVEAEKEEEEEAEEPICTVEVRGYRIGSEGTIEIYFENTKRSGGDEIVKFDPVHSSGVIFITFASEEVARRVAEQKHIVAGCTLDVKLYDPPKHKSAQNLSQICSKEPEEYVPRCTIEVRGVTKNLNLTTLKLYFENKKLSGGDEIVKFEYKEDIEIVYITYESEEVCERVLQRKHKIDGSELQVSMYYECLGCISEDDNGPSFKCPKPLKLEGLEFGKMQFLMKSEPNRIVLEKQLQDCFTLIQWPQTEADCTTLTCTLTSDVQDCKNKALTWAKQAEQNLHDFLKVISVHEYKVFKDIFETVLHNLQNLVIANPDGVALFVKKAEFSIQVVGYTALATVVVKDIEDIIKTAKTEFDRKKKQTKMSLTTLKYHQLKLLLAVKYPSKMEQTCNGLKVKINLNKNEIVFEGLMEDIRTAQVAMYEEIDNAAVSQLKNLPEGRLFLYKSKEVKDYIVAKLKSKKLVGVWEVEGTDLNIYANSEEVVVQSADIINDSVKEHQKDLEALHRSVIQSQQWNDKMKDLDKQHHGKLHIVLAKDFSKLFLYFTDDIFGAVIEEVDDFLSRNTILEKQVTCKSGIIHLIERRKRNEFEQIAKDLVHCYVQITIQSQVGFLIHGNQNGINQATTQLKQLIDKVRHREHELVKPGIVEYMEGKGKEHVATVENQVPCVIQTRGQEHDSEENEEVDNLGIPGMPVNIISAESSVFGNISVKVVRGEMANEKVDVIVNTTSNSLDLTSGSVSKSLLVKGGQIMQEECKKKYPNGIKDGDIAVTGGGNLACRIVCHGALKQWGDETTAKKILNGLMKKCLDQCEKDGFTSIAFPALGTGNLNYPRHIVAKEMFQHISTYSRDNPFSSMTEVRFVVYQNDFLTIKAFESEQQKWLSRVSRAGTRTSRYSLSAEDNSMMPGMPVNIMFGESSVVGNISIKVVRGEMASEKVDVIVNTTSNSLDLTNGNVSKSLLVKGGQIMQEECKKKYPNGIKDGDIAVTGGGNLACRIVCHGALKQWGDETTAKKILNGLMKKCLDQCEKDGFTSIAFPALGTGNLNYPRHIVAKEMFQHISTYSRDNPLSSVTEVRFVVYQNDLLTIKTFESEQQKWLSRVSRAGTLTSQYSLSAEDNSSGGDEQVSVKVPLKSQLRKAVVPINTVWIDVYAWENSDLAVAISKLNFLIKNDFTAAAGFAEPVIPDQKQISVEEYVEEVEDVEEEEEKEPPCHTIEVRGFTETIVEEVLEFYFGNSKRSGGGEVSGVEITDGVALITFEDENIAKRVTEREHVVVGCTLDVKLYEPPKCKSDRHLSQICSKEPEESVPHCTIEVRGVTKKLDLTTLQLYFENKKRSGGDEIVKFEYREDNEIAYITYECEEVAQRVASHGPHKVEGQPLEVKLYIPPPPRPAYEDKALLAGLASKVTHDGLTNFLEAKIGLTTADFLYDLESSQCRMGIREMFLDEFCKEKLEAFLLVKRNDFVIENLLQVILGNNNKEALCIIMAYISKKWKEDFGDNTITVWLGLDHRGEKTGEEVLVCFHSADIVSKFSQYLGLPMIYRRFDETEMEPLENRLKEKYQRVSLDKNDAATIKCLINEHGENLFNIHSNLEAISASSVKSRQNGIIEQTSILLYCRLKGVIPYGEEFFPEQLRLDKQCYPTDIREGFFSLGMNPAQRQPSVPHPHLFNNPLRMGCSIGTSGYPFAGTLGPIVRLDTNDIGFLTCAHVLGINNSLNQTPVVQPADIESGLPDGTRLCGTFVKEKFDPLAKIGVDAALVRINQTNRDVDPGGFVWIGSHQLLSTGFSGSKSPSFEDGIVIVSPEFEKLAEKRVYKFGRTTGLTQGLFALDGAMLKVHNASLSLPHGMQTPHGHSSNDFIMKGQFLIQKVGNDQFFSSGDSGAGVYVVKRKHGENRLALVGIAIGSITSGECAMTPIGSVLEALGLQESSIMTETGMEINA